MLNDEIIEKILDICMYDLSASCDREAHISYIKYRLNGGEKTEEDWYLEE